MLFYFALTLTFLFILIIRGSFLSFLLPGRDLPDILLVIVIISGFLLREKKGALTGFLGGLLQDLLYGHAIGFFALSRMLMGYAAGLAGRGIYREKIAGPVIIVFVGTILHELLMFVLVYIFVGKVVFAWGMMGQFAGQAALNSLLTLFLYPLFFWLFRKSKIPV